MTDKNKQTPNFKKAKELFNSYMPDRVKSQEHTNIYQHIQRHKLCKAALYDGVCLLMANKQLERTEFEEIVKEINLTHPIRTVKTLTQG